MKVNVTQSAPEKSKSDILVVPVYDDSTTQLPLFKDLDKLCENKLSKRLKEVKNKLKAPGSLNFYGLNGVSASHVLLVSVGTKKDLSINHIRQAAGTAGQYARQNSASSMTFCVDSELKLDSEALGQAIVEGARLGNYQFNTYKSDKSSIDLGSVSIVCNDKDQVSALKKGAESGIITGNATRISRDLANTPANDLTPAAFVEYAKKTLPKSVAIEVIDKKHAKKLGMNAFLGVAQGSDNDPFMLVAKYLPNKKEAPICLVGKGVTFDTGGISLKPGNGMYAMKGDMSGAASTLGAMYGIASLKLNHNVIAVMPLVENMPSGHAQRPGDVVKAMNGKTIEIFNTDAEGRLILADALCYAVEQKPKSIINMATLTGACVVALGTAAVGLFSNSDKLASDLIDIGTKTGDRAWRLPLYDDYLVQLKSTVADIAHMDESREGGSCTAAKFLEQFVDGVDWAHLDIAPLMDTSKTQGYHVKGMLGACARNLIEYVKRQSQ